MKKIITTILLSSLVCASVVGCTNQNNGPATVQENNGEIGDYAIATENVRIKQYKGLEVDGYDTTVTEDMIDDYIQYIIDYVYLPEQEAATAPEEAVEETPASEASTEASTESTEVPAEEVADEAQAESTAPADASEASSEASDAATEATSEEVVPEAPQPEKKPTIKAQDLTNELVEKITNGEYATVESYRKYVHETIKEQNEDYYNNLISSTLFQQVLDGSELLNYDEVSLQSYIDYANEYYQEYAEYMNVEFEEFIKTTLNLESTDAYNDFVKNEALENLKAEYVINAIADAENIVISPTDIEEQVQTYINDGYFSDKDQVLEFITEAEIETNLKYTKILEILVENAIITVVENPDASAGMSTVEEITDEALEEMEINEQVEELLNNESTEGESVVEEAPVEESTEATTEAVEENNAEVENSAEAGSSN